MSIMAVTNMIESRMDLCSKWERAITTTGIKITPTIREKRRLVVEVDFMMMSRPDCLLEPSKLA